MDSGLEGQTLPPALLPKLKSVMLDISNGDRLGLWSARNLELLGLDAAPADCTVTVEADAAILHLRKLHTILAESGVLPRVRSLTQQSWGLHGAPAKFGADVEVSYANDPQHAIVENVLTTKYGSWEQRLIGCLREQVSAKLKLVRVECIDALIHNTLEHDNLASLCFAPMLQKAWSRGLVREINRSAAATLRNLTVHFRSPSFSPIHSHVPWRGSHGSDLVFHVSRPYQEITLAPLAGADLPHLEHLELRAQNESGFGPAALQPLATANLPKLKCASLPSHCCSRHLLNIAPSQSPVADEL